MNDDAKTMGEAASEWAQETADKATETAEDMRARLARAAGDAGEAVMDAANRTYERAEELGGAAYERGEALVSSVTDITSRNLRSAGETTRDFARRNPELLIAGAALVGLGIAAWLRGGVSRTMEAQDSGSSYDNRASHRQGNDNNRNRRGRKAG